MITDFKLKNYLSFNEENISFKKGLIIFSGASGSGKSILMKAILDSFGIENTEAKFVQSIYSNQLKNIENYGIEKEEEYIFTKQKKEKTRFLINNQLITKKKIEEVSSQIIKYLHLKDLSDFENKNLIKILDTIIIKSNPEHQKTIDNFLKTLKTLKTLEKRIEELKTDEKRIEEEKEFLKFEISKIKEVSLKKEEYLQLKEIKEKLSKSDKIQEKIQKCYSLFEIENHLFNFLSFIEEDSTQLSEAIEDFKNTIYKVEKELKEYEEYDIENILDEIQKYASLKRKYGEFEDIVKALEEKESKLKKLENIEFEKTKLNKELNKTENEINDILLKLNKNREKFLSKFQKQLKEYTDLLFIQNLTIELSEKELNEEGNKELKIKLNNTDINNISTGEFNRIRLAILALKTKYFDDTGVLMLDEIDSNLSGEESMSVAKVLKTLAIKYQVFSISHLPQLTSQADQHFLVYKKNNQSKVRELNKTERINEIARLISGTEITEEAKIFANKFISAS